MGIENPLVTIGIPLQLGGGVLAEQLMHLVTSGVGVGGEQRLADEAGEAAQRRPGYRLGRLPAETTTEHGERHESVPLLRAEQDP